MPYLLISLVAAIAAAVFTYLETWSLLLSLLAYVGAGFSVMIIALMVPALVTRAERQEPTRT